MKNVQGNAMKSPRAYAHYRELVVTANASPIVLNQETDLTDAELRWCDLTPLESWVFGIEPSLLNMLVYAHVRYQDMIGITDQEFSEFREEERSAFAKRFHGDLVYSLDGAIGFMIDACEVPFEQAAMWVCRAQVQNVRSGLYDAHPDAPDWAHGIVDAEGAYEDLGSWSLEIARGF